MWYILATIATLSGMPIGEGVMINPYSDKASCQDAIANNLQVVSAELEQRGAKLSSAVCVQKDDLPADLKAKIDAHQS
jgi:hypothetical protein